LRHARSADVSSASHSAFIASRNTRCSIRFHCFGATSKPNAGTAIGSNVPDFFVCLLHLHYASKPRQPTFVPPPLQRITISMSVLGGTSWQRPSLVGMTRTSCVSTSRIATASDPRPHRICPYPFPGSSLQHLSDSRHFNDVHTCGLPMSTITWSFSAR
jgi:hypothetical protein